MQRSELRATRTEVTSEVAVVSAGHMAEAEAGVRVVAAGGNAVDAVVAAAFAGCVVEPHDVQRRGLRPARAACARAGLLHRRPLAPRAAGSACGHVRDRRVDPAHLLRLATHQGAAQRVGPPLRARAGHRRGPLPGARALGAAAPRRGARARDRAGRGRAADDLGSGHRDRRAPRASCGLPHAAALLLDDGAIPKATAPRRLDLSDLARVLREIAARGPGRLLRRLGGRGDRARDARGRRHADRGRPRGLQAARAVRATGPVRGLRLHHGLRPGRLRGAQHPGVLRPAGARPALGRAQAPDGRGARPCLRRLDAALRRPRLRAQSRRRPREPGLRGRARAGDLAGASRAEADRARRSLALRDRGAGAGATAGRPSAGGVRGTSQMAAVDRDGLMCSLCTTVGSTFGSGVLVPGTGMFLTNAMQNYDPRPDRANRIEPGRMPIFGVPEIVAARDGEAVFAAAGSGGYRITTGVLTRWSGRSCTGSGCRRRSTSRACTTRAARRSWTRASRQRRSGWRARS